MEEVEELPRNRSVLEPPIRVFFPTLRTAVIWKNCHVTRPRILYDREPTPPPPLAIYFFIHRRFIHFFLM